MNVVKRPIHSTESGYLILQTVLIVDIIITKLFHYTILAVELIFLTFGFRKGRKKLEGFEKNIFTAIVR